MPVYALGDDPTRFPDPAQAVDDPNGLLAVGGDLSPERLLAAYRQGIFPWYSPGDPILWWCPDPRTVISPESLHISRSLAKWHRNPRYELTSNRDFAAVVAGCAAPRADQSGTWIVPEMQDAYLQLHQLGYAHSVEVWRGNELVGGLYGVRLGRVFFGESMFSRAPNASKLALVHILRDQALGPIELLDCQFTTPHLLSMGATEWPRARFLATIRQLIVDRAT